jgi:hypothetical protein
MTKIKGKLQILPEVQNHDCRTKSRAKGFIKFIEMANKAPHLHSSTRKMANNYLSGLSKKYHREIPISESINTLKDKFGIVVLQEAGTE